jgi:hypothetical protein
MNDNLVPKVGDKVRVTLPLTRKNGRHLTGLYCVEAVLSDGRVKLVGRKPYFRPHILELVSREPVTGARRRVVELVLSVLKASEATAKDAVFLAALRQRRRTLARELKQLTT